MTDSPEILIIDDNFGNLEVLTDILTKAGYRVAAVRSGERALKQLQNYLPELILLDIKMPGLDGLETCRRIKQTPAMLPIPIIFITALPDVDSIAACFSLGAVDYISKPIQAIELLSRVKNHLELHSLRQSLERQVVQRTHDLEMALAYLQDTLIHLQTAYLKMLQSERMATHDALTELPNRRLLMDRLERAIAKANYQGQRFALIFLDLDGFKQVNDTYSHQVGDQLLIQVARVLRLKLRREDDLFRLGGDEFVFLIEQVDSAGTVLDLTRRLLDSLLQPFAIDDQRLAIGGSFGIKIYNGHPRQTRVQVLADADSAMYRAKAQRNAIAFHGEANLYQVR
ncbi:diguanylate cyclase domain-containing protein [Leptolyngbya sp. KIOST-1]|uniref:diguanylate cyclase domain-containing protein n=1 Tax=Leptolyngbya sp. KIOST-1 TaxID=1229172 RepID=UPI0006923FAC|nr:diguanylate cyclase [Leptolyngbya sp. KIOST-1]